MAFGPAIEHQISGPSGAARPFAPSSLPVHSQFIPSSLPVRSPFTPSPFPVHSGAACAPTSDLRTVMRIRNSSIHDGTKTVQPNGIALVGISSATVFDVSEERRMGRNGTCDTRVCT